MITFQKNTLKRVNDIGDKGEQLWQGQKNAMLRVRMEMAHSE